MDVVVTPYPSELKSDILWDDGDLSVSCTTCAYYCTEKCTDDPESCWDGYIEWLRFRRAGDGYKNRCRDCAWLQELNGRWFCDDKRWYCEDVVLCEAVDDA